MNLPQIKGLKRFLKVNKIQSVKIFLICGENIQFGMKAD